MAHSEHQMKQKEMAREEAERHLRYAQADGSMAAVREQKYKELGPALMARHNRQKTRENAESMVKEGKEKYGLNMEIE